MKTIEYKNINQFGGFIIIELNMVKFVCVSKNNFKN